MDEILDEAHAIYHVCYDHAMDKRDVKKCSFAWRVAGKAQCELHARKKDEKWLNIAPSVLKELL
ncbi:putative RNA-dependent RNA polymerase, eukaryotic-type [Rosa chinensis]|uniref:Putative RNA-dependent RNA polymerase, eukaryotic-type n=1 Tax=Rosa chinensis TaxID=74649 RepID=A0A2P6RJS4_ROSCH|nr:putative RNA-dependent RNA polymerase, eukaryotic-type [Rosa chinensis]